MPGAGLGPDGYKAALTAHVIELIKASGRKADATEIVGRMLYQFGFPAFFDLDDRIRTNEVAAALIQFLPPGAPTADMEHAAKLAEAKRTWYGEITEAAFLKLDPVERVRRLHAAEYRDETPIATPDNGYGFGSMEEFNKLPALTRMQIVDRAEHDAKEREKKATQAQADTTAAANLPADWSSWGYMRKLEYANKATYDEEIRRRAASDKMYGNA